MADTFDFVERVPQVLGKCDAAELCGPMFLLAAHQAQTAAGYEGDQLSQEAQLSTLHGGLDVIGCSLSRPAREARLGEVASAAAQDALVPVGSRSHRIDTQDLVTAQNG